MNKDRFKFRVWRSGVRDYELLLQDSGELYEEQFVGYEGLSLRSVPDAIIEQCTGMRDEHGKLIYEGDILRCYGPDGELAVRVGWDDWMGGWLGYERGKTLGTCLQSVTPAHELVDYEIIGNIHQNPELLEALGDE